MRARAARSGERRVADLSVRNNETQSILEDHDWRDASAVGEVTAVENLLAQSHPAVALRHLSAPRIAVCKQHICMATAPRCAAPIHHKTVRST